MLIAGALTAAAADPDRPDRYLEVAVDGGANGSQSTDVPLFGAVLVAPGDHDRRRLMVKNTGPDRAVMTATITDLNLDGDDSDGFFSDFLINGASASSWDSSDKAELKRADLGPGESTAVDVSYDFPASATSGNKADDNLHVSFDVRVELEELPGQSAARQQSAWSRTAALMAAAAAAFCALGTSALVGARMVRARRTGAGGNGDDE